MHRQCGSSVEFLNSAWRLRDTSSSRGPPGVRAEMTTVLPHGRSTVISRSPTLAVEIDLSRELRGVIAHLRLRPLLVTAAFSLFRLLPSPPGGQEGGQSGR
jgi:hypothetical protein